MRTTTAKCDRCGKEMQFMDVVLPFPGEFKGIELRIDPHYMGPYGKRIFRINRDLCGKECFEADLEQILAESRQS